MVLSIRGTLAVKHISAEYFRTPSIIPVPVETQDSKLLQEEVHGHSLEVSLILSCHLNVSAAVYIHPQLIRGNKELGFVNIVISQ